MAKPMPDITERDPPTTQEVERNYVISPPLVRESARSRVIKITRTDANGNRSVTEVHLLGELLTD